MQLLENGSRTLFRIRSMLLQRLYDKMSTITWNMRFAAAARTTWTSCFALSKKVLLLRYKNRSAPDWLLLLFAKQTNTSAASAIPDILQCQPTFRSPHQASVVQ